MAIAGNPNWRLKIEHKSSITGGHILVYVWDGDSNDFLTYRRVSKPGWWDRFWGVTWEDKVVTEVAKQLAKVKSKAGVVTEKQEAEGIIKKINTDVLFE